MSDDARNQDIMKAVGECYARSIALRREGKKHAVKLDGYSLGEFWEALDADGSYYEEGGTMIGSNERDCYITPTEIEREHGIATEHEGHLLVAW